MGGRDKGWVHWHGKPFIEHVLSRMRAQTWAPDELLISANRSLQDYVSTGARVIPDERAGFAGPLAGVEAGLLRAQSPWVVVVPCDMPNIPLDYAQRLLAGGLNYSGCASTVVASVGGQLQPLCVCVPKSALPSIQVYLDAGGARVRTWLQQQGAQTVAFEDERAFSNINSIEEE